MKTFNFILLLLGACAIADAVQDGKDKWKMDICKCISRKPKVCAPGTTKMEECNPCTCSSDGTEWTCQKNECPKPVCEPNSKTNLNCERCTCSNDGMENVCRRVYECVPDEKCEPKTQVQGCCICEDDGVGYTCYVECL